MTPSSPILQEHERHPDRHQPSLGGAEDMITALALLPRAIAMEMRAICCPSPAKAFPESRHEERGE